MKLESIGINIRKKREEKAWSREVLAERVDLSTVYIGMIERGEKMPRMETFVRIINELGVSADEILEDVVNVSYQVRMSRYMEQIERLSKGDREKVFQIIDIFLRDK